LEKKVEQLEKVNLELRFKLIEQERIKIIQEVKTKYPEMINTIET
jgi:hypothetical protein